MRNKELFCPGLSRAGCKDGFGRQRTIPRHHQHQSYYATHPQPPSEKNTERFFRDTSARNPVRSQLHSSLPFPPRRALLRCGQAVPRPGLLYRHLTSVLFPNDPAKLVTPSTCINFDLLYRNGTKTGSRFPAIQALPRALAQVSSRRPRQCEPKMASVLFGALRQRTAQRSTVCSSTPEVRPVFFIHLIDFPWQLPIKTRY